MARQCCAMKVSRKELTANTAADILTDEQASSLFNVEPRTLRLWRLTRGLPHIKITSKVIRYRRADLDAWIARHSVVMVQE